MKEVYAGLLHEQLSRQANNVSARTSPLHKGSPFLALKTDILSSGELRTEIAHEYTHSRLAMQTGTYSAPTIQ